MKQSDDFAQIESEQPEATIVGMMTLNQFATAKLTVEEYLRGGLMPYASRSILPTEKAAAA